MATMLNLHLISAAFAFEPGFLAADYGSEHTLATVR
jgi:hypothetical protein